MATRRPVGFDRSAGVSPAASACNAARFPCEGIASSSADLLTTDAVASLRSLSYRVIAASDAREALQALEANQTIELLFSDVMLGPGMSGTELADAARQRRPGLAVLLTSGYDNAMTDSSMGAAFEMLRKPYRREQLGVAIRRLLRSAG